MARLLRVSLIAALAVAVLLVGVLSKQVRDLRALLAEAQLQALFPRAGDIVPPFDAPALGGFRVRIGEGPPGSRQLLIVFNATCPSCLENAPAWRRLDSLVAGARGLTVLGWSQNPDVPTRRFVTEQGFRFPVVVPDARWILPYKLEGVPNTLVIGHDGRVLYARPGVLTPAAADSAVVAARRG